MVSEAITKRNPVIEVFVAFLKLGFTSFGGPVAHISYFRAELVEKRQWLSESQFSQLFAIAQFLPGPASSQLGFALGLLRAGWLGAICAFLAFTLPSAILLVGFAGLLPLFSGHLGEAAIHGLKIVALVVVADAVLGMAKKLCPDQIRGMIAAVAAAVLIAAEMAMAQLGVVIAGAIAGMVLCRIQTPAADSVIQVKYGARAGGLLLGAFVLLLMGLPLLATAGGILPTIANLFYQAGALVFGGGHVVLPLLENSLVATTGLITQAQFLAGYGASQAIPGPLFAFAGYLGAIIPSEGGWLTGATIALIFIFLPGFLLMAGLLPMWHLVSRNETSANAIAGVNAAVVGLLAAALYDPIFTSAITDKADLAIAVTAFALLSIWRLPVLAAVVWCVLASVGTVLV